MTTTVMTTNDAKPQPPLIHALLTEPACYAHAVDRVRLVETHISWVLLTGEFAYKIKKPVNLGFLDFSTLALRQQACAEEVRLNRRLAEETYLGVMAITGSPESPHVDGQGGVIEYTVKMRQFPPEDTLDRLSERGELESTQIDALAQRLAKFHMADCETAAPESEWGEPDVILKSVADNFSMLLGSLDNPVLRESLVRLQSWSIAEHARLTPLMRERKHQGRVRECHGDMHLGNLAWVDGLLIIFDCIEFNPALRWIDVMSEVAFCFMDLQHRNHRDLAFRFLNAWLEASGDYQGVPLLRYYTVYRAMVRTKVAALRAQQSSGDMAKINECMQLAETLTQAMPPRLWITHGLSGSGKTTLSQSVLQQHGMVRLRSDVERKRLAGLAVSVPSGNGINEGLYTQDASRRTYAHLAKQAEVILEAGWPVVVDAAFLARWQRDLFMGIAQRHKLLFSIIDVKADHDTLRERIVRRNAQGQDASEADLRVLQYQIETAEPLGECELKEVIFPDRVVV